MTDEEMAEEYAKGLCKTCTVDTCRYSTIQTCAIKESIKQAHFAGLKAGRSVWHKVADGDLPKESILVLAYSKKEDISLTECLYIPGEGFKHPVFSEWYTPTAWIEKEKILPKE